MVLPCGLQEADISITAGKIAGIWGRGQRVLAREELDVSGLVVMPGVVDPHVHMRDPGRTDQEDFASGTRAAALGGVTTVLDHPNTVPPVASVADLESKRARLEAKSYADFGLYGAGGADNLGDIGALAEAGVVAFKTFLTEPPPGREEEYRGLCVTDDGALYDLMRTVAETGLPLAVHAENHAIIKRLGKRMLASGDTRGDAHARSHPVVTEQEAITRVCLLAGATECRVHIPHISSGSGALAGIEARKRGVRVTLETCPHYLFFSSEDLNRLGPYAKVDPPLRSRQEQDLLWSLVAEGAIDCLGSDHAPHSASLKQKGWENIFAAPSGIPGVELLLPLTLTAVSQGRLDLALASRLLSRNAAVTFGLYPRKGEIRIGADADLAVVDPRLAWTVEAQKLATKSRATALLYDGFRVTGRVVMTFLRGTLVAREGEMLVPPGGGQWLRPLSPSCRRLGGDADA